MAGEQNNNHSEIARLQEIYQTVQQLKAEKAAMEDENRELRDENNALRTQIQTLKTQVKEIEDKNLNLLTAKSVSSHQADHQMIKSKIDHFVAEIDKCLAMLKSQGGT
jgi:cell division protein FtsB